MLEYKNWSYLALLGMIALIVLENNILYLIKSLTSLNLVDLEVLVRLFTYHSSNL